RYLTDAAIRAMVRAETTTEFFASPQRYVLGASEDAFADGDRWTAIMGRVLALGTNEEGEKPAVGQFPAQPPEQMWSTYRQLAQNFCRSEEHTSELQSRFDLVCRLLLEKKNDNTYASI